MFSIEKEKIMKLSWVTVTVKDMDESIRFYTDIVGLDGIQPPAGRTRYRYWLF